MKNKMNHFAILGVLAIVLSFAFKPLHHKKTIVIDAGHGGKDFGAQNETASEKKIVESIANKIYSLNDKNDIEIILLRKDDSFVELNKRISKINKIHPDLMISLHVNSSTNSNENGVIAYVSKQNEFYGKSKEEAQKLIDKIANDKIAKGEVKEANMSLIKNSKCPSVLLEIGYLSNENDKSYLTSENGQNEIANKIFESIKQ